MLAFIKSLSPMLITCVVAGTLLAVLAPLGTQAFAPVYRFSYWIGLCLAGGIGAGAVNYYEHRRAVEFAPWPMAFLQSVTSALTVSCVILAIAVRQYGMPSLFHIGQTLFYVWVISLAISSIGALLRQNKRAASDAADARPARRCINACRPNCAKQRFTRSPPKTIMSA